MPIELPKDEFEILADDEERIVLYDKVVDINYTYSKAEQKWQFPRGARMDVIYKLSGLDLTGGEL